MLLRLLGVFAVLLFDPCPYSVKDVLLPRAQLHSLRPGRYAAPWGSALPTFPSAGLMAGGSAYGRRVGLMAGGSAPALPPPPAAAGLRARPSHIHVVVVFSPPCPPPPPCPRTPSCSFLEDAASSPSSRLPASAMAPHLVALLHPSALADVHRVAATVSSQACPPGPTYGGHDTGAKGRRREGCDPPVHHT